MPTIGDFNGLSEKGIAFSFPGRMNFLALTIQQK